MVTEGSPQGGGGGCLWVTNCDQNLRLQVSDVILGRVSMLLGRDVVLMSVDD